eukprot:Opistho-1_new@91787
MAEAAFNETLQWTFGLIASTGKYLTAETFGNQINANGPNLKKKQIFTLEQDAGSPVVYVKSHLGKYFSATEKGVFTCDQDAKGKNEQWTVEPQSDGKWAFKSAHGYYLGGSADKLSAFGRAIGETEKWTVHLAMHPQVVLRNVGRKRYVHLQDEELRVVTDIPWGTSSLITLEFHDGKYSLRAANNKLLHKDGKLVDTLDDNTKYIIEFLESRIALRACDGKYLQGHGPKATLSAKKDKITKDELFELEDSHPQVTLVAHNGRFTSSKQIEETKADQREVTDTEIFQLEPHGDKWAFRNNKGQYWSVTAGTISGNAKTRGANELFTVAWHGTQISIKGANGKFVSAKPNGQLSASADAAEEKEKFTITLINRPQIVLRGEYGFLASKARSVISCASVTAEIFHMEAKDGKYSLKGTNGKWWKEVDDGQWGTAGDAPVEFTIEIHTHSKLVLRAPNGKFFKGEQHGGFKATSDKADKDELLEY